MYSQSVYPIQRVEGNDTVVVMTKAQAVAMNQRFLSMDSTIKAYKFKYHQYHQASESLAKQDSVIADLNRQLLIKPVFKKMTQQDVLMSSYFILFTTALLYMNFK
jgi:hypothetical protein